MSLIGRLRSYLGNLEREQACTRGVLYQRRWAYRFQSCSQAKRVVFDLAATWKETVRPAYRIRSSSAPTLLSSSRSRELPPERVAPEACCGTRRRGPRCGPP